MISPAPGVSAILRRGDKYAVVFSNKRNRAPVVPGGKVEATDASYADACTRETREEAGVEVAFGEPLRCVTHVGTNGKIYDNYIFEGHLPDDVELAPVGEEGPTGWLTIEELRAQSPFSLVYEDASIGLKPATGKREGSIYVPLGKPTRGMASLPKLLEAVRKVWPEAVYTDLTVEPSDVHPGPHAPWMLFSKDAAVDADLEKNGVTAENEAHAIQAFILPRGYELVHDSFQGSPCEQATFEMAMILFQIERSETR